MDAVRKQVEELVQVELDSANEKFPMFSSMHEGYAVILEEVEEAKENFENVNTALQEVWEQIKANDVVNSSECDIYVLRGEAINLAIESIQVAAMAQKFINTLVEDI